MIGQSEVDVAEAQFRFFRTMFIFIHLSRQDFEMHVCHFFFFFFTSLLIYTVRFFFITVL